MQARRARSWVPLARRQLLHEPLKLGLATAGVALAVALVGLLFGLREGINRQVTAYEDNAGADIYVGSREVRSFATPGSSAVPVATGQALAAVPGVDETAPITNGLTVLRLHDSRVASLLVGFEPGRLGGPWTMGEGRPPRAEGEIAVDSVLADTHGIELGATLHVRDRALRVVGTTDGTASWMTPLIFVTRSTANALERRRDTATFFLVRSGGRDPGTLAGELRRRFPKLGVMTRDEIAENSRELSSRAFNSPLLVMAVIGLAIGALVIGLSAYGFVTERRAEYGALKAIGARSSRLYRVVTWQALAIAAVGLGSGILLAQLASWGIHSAWPKFLFVSLGSHYVLLLGAALAMGLTGALVPIRTLARLDPAEVFRR